MRRVAWVASVPVLLLLAFLGWIGGLRGDAGEDGGVLQARGQQADDGRAAVEPRRVGARADGVVPGTLVWPGAAAPVLASFSDVGAYDTLFGAIDYSDPTARGAVPLIFVRGLEEEAVSRHFEVKDFVSSTEAAYVRIAPELVRGLERMAAVASAPIYITSGYRHPVYNFDPAVGGARRSQHMAGRAVDLWSAELDPGALAELAVDALGCEIGIGLGDTYLHVDVRGYRATWTSEGAAMDEVTFDAWVHARCAFWEAGVDDPLAEPPAFAEALRAVETAADTVATRVPVDPIAPYQDVVLEYAQIQQELGKHGAVVLDLRGGDGTTYDLSYVPSGGAEARRWGVDPLLRATDPERYVVYVIVRRDGRNVVGAVSYAAEPDSVAAGGTP